MSEVPWIRFFPSDWLAGTRGLSASETGVYITLIATMYERGHPLPEDHGRLARLCGASNSSFKSALEALTVGGKILRVEGGLWNERVGKEGQHRAEKSEAARAAASYRWENQKVEVPSYPSEIREVGTDPTTSVGSEKPQSNQSTSTADASPAHRKNDATRAGVRNQRPEIRKKDISLTTFERSAREREFDDLFWPPYPQKKKKPEALKAWFKARELASAADIVAGVARYAAEKPDWQEWAYPASWLNGERWKDEPAPPPVPEASRGPPTYGSMLRNTREFIAEERINGSAQPSFSDKLSTYHAPLLPGPSKPG